MLRNLRIEGGGEGGSVHSNRLIAAWETRNSTEQVDQKNLQKCPTMVFLKRKYSKISFKSKKSHFNIVLSLLMTYFNVDLFQIQVLKMTEQRDMLNIVTKQNNEKLWIEIYV